MSIGTKYADAKPPHIASRPHMRIAIVYDAVYPYSLGGGERRYYELAIRLAQAGHEVHWYGMRWWSGPRIMHKDGVTYHAICPKLPLYTRSGRRSIIEAFIFGLLAIQLVGCQVRRGGLLRLPVLLDFHSPFRCRRARGATHQYLA